MKSITVCVGSSCHVKGSHRVIDRLGELIHQHGLDDDVELKASFCMERCKGNIGTIINGKQIEDMTLDSVDEVFSREILGDVNK